jgi:glycosyltransferase involved in cell wall biosynthesis
MDTGSRAPLRAAFITSTPLNVREGSGTFVGIATLADALRAMGAQVDVIAPRKRLPILTAGRLLFNASLARRPWDDYDVTVGFDLDGYRIAGHSVPGHKPRPHLAAIKGVIADEMRFERGLTRATMSWQAQREARHVQRADRVITTSRYSADRLKQFYGVTREPGVVPEVIDLTAWREVLRQESRAPDPARFVVLCVCRLYRRKRVDLLLRATAELQSRIPRFELRIAGEGPELNTLGRLWRSLELGPAVRWLGTLDRRQLAREYGHCDVFCLPSVQEGFGIVFLEAMAASRPIVAARAAAAPEVVPHALVVEPESHRALAQALETLYHRPDLRQSIAAAGATLVEQYDAPRVAGLFLAELERLANRVRVARGA